MDDFVKISDLSALTERATNKCANHAMFNQVGAIRNKQAEAEVIHNRGVMRPTVGMLTHQSFHVIMPCPLVEQIGKKPKRSIVKELESSQRFSNFSCQF
jgi:hypothetical protein